MPKLNFSSRDATQFGAILRRLRLERGWSIVTAARRSGMNPNYLGSLEKGGNMPSLDTLLETADVYGVWAADIVREVEEARRAARAQHAALVTKTTPEG
jgi:transcriptional regulator with XRE-family HTH domain